VFALTLVATQCLSIPLSHYLAFPNYYQYCAVRGIHPRRVPLQSASPQAATGESCELVEVVAPCLCPLVGSHGNRVSALGAESRRSNGLSIVRRRE